jgi:hypothetical protein
MPTVVLCMSPMFDWYRSGWYSIESGMHTRFARHELGFMFVVGKRNLLVALLFGFWP